MLLIGTADGVLLVYDVRENTNTEPFQSTMINTKKNFAKKPIEQLAVVEELDLLLCLTGILLLVLTSYLTPLAQSRRHGEPARLVDL